MGASSVVLALQHVMLFFALEALGVCIARRGTSEAVELLG